MDYDTPAMPPKVSDFEDVNDLLATLERKAALWHRTARENLDRAEDFDRAAEEVRAGATTVTVGRTTYRLDGSRDAAHTER